MSWIDEEDEDDEEDAALNALFEALVRKQPIPRGANRITIPRVTMVRQEAEDFVRDDFNI